MTREKTEHTPTMNLPLHFDRPSGCVEDANGQVVAVVSQWKDHMHRGHEIVRACNSHDALVAALERIAHTSSDCISGDTARSALKQAKGE